LFSRRVRKRNEKNALSTFQTELIIGNFLLSNTLLTTTNSSVIMSKEQLNYELR